MLRSSLVVVIPLFDDCDHILVEESNFWAPKWINCEAIGIRKSTIQTNFTFSKKKTNKNKIQNTKNFTKPEYHFISPTIS